MHWHCKIEEYAIIYVGSLNHSNLPTSIPPPPTCLNKAEIIDWEYSTTIKVCLNCIRVVYPLDVYMFRSWLQETEICNKIFYNSSAKKRHMKTIHQTVMEDSRKGHIYCPLCNEESLGTYTNLDKHMHQTHNKVINRKILHFAGKQEYDNWIGDEKLEINYSKWRTKKASDHTELYYFCNPSNVVECQRKGTIRSEKTGGSIKINGVCPSRVFKFFHNGQITVTFYVTHVEHEDEIRTKHLPRREMLGSCKWECQQIESLKMQEKLLLKVEMDDDEAAAVTQIQQDIEEAEVDILAVPRRFLVNEDAFAISDAAFIKNFRLSKNLCRTLIELVRPYIVPPSRRSALTLETKVLVSLIFYGHGHYQEGVGRNLFPAISQASVSRCLSEVTNALNNINIIQRFIHFPENIDELRQLRARNIRTTIERCNGVLKNRFRCLLKHRVLHYQPQTAAKIVNACAVLHNLCTDNNIEDPDNNLETMDFGIYPEDDNQVAAPVNALNPDPVASNQLRARITANIN
ncbi:dde superfamily endonuclease [Holotrichia oblita]|uniref:Dde superfamily endonuclease n=1 Tax=Holotrichia oblita TaxID=644536 RepID=A0ACB9SQA0_HOLOL|nr:dde superfamily endonuclease [Holotrichia oblita]